jgi:oligosaccharyltransferase complex subunit beta
MRWSFSSLLVLAWTAAVAAKSFSGNRLLVVLEEQSEREKYSVFLEDLTCKLWFI